MKKMLYKKIILPLCVLFLTVTIVHAQYNFVGGGATTELLDASNYSGGIAPPNPLPAGASITISAYCSQSTDYTNQGDIIINSGGQLEVIGTFTNAAGSTLTDNGSGGLIITYTLLNIGSITVIDCTLNGGTLLNQANSYVTVLGTINLAAEYSSIQNSGTMEIAQITDVRGTQISNYGTLTLHGASPTEGSTINAAFSNLPGGIFINESVLHFTDNASFENQSTATVQLTASSNITNDSYFFQNYGTIVNDGTVLTISNITNNGTFTNTSTSVFTISGTGSVSNNTGYLNIFEVLGGTLNIIGIMQGNTNYDGATILSGTMGIFEGNLQFSNVNTIEPGGNGTGGDFDIVPSTAQSFANQILNIDIISYSLNDYINIQGSADLTDLTINVQLLDGFIPAANTQFNLISASFTNTTFPTITFPPLPAGLMWEAYYAGQNFGVRVVADQLLPVNLTSFTAKAVNTNEALLTWKTASETNVNKFQIEHSADGKDFVLIGEVSAYNTGLSQQDYSFRHIKLRPGSHYYRLKVIDTNGENTYSNVEIVNIDNTATVTVLNSANVANILHVVSSQDQSIKICSILGQDLITTYLTEGTHQVDISQFAKGVYLITTETSTLKFVRQ